MTCLVAIAEKNKIWMGCDTLITTSTTKDRVDTKIIKKDGVILGLAGNLRDLQLIRFGLEVPEHKEDTSDYEYVAKALTNSIKESLGICDIDHTEDGKGSYNLSVLLGYKSRLYLLRGDFSITRVENHNYAAWGNGFLPAIGSLYTTENMKMTPRERIILALEASEKFINTVERPFVVECLE